MSNRPNRCALAGRATLLLACATACIALVFACFGCASPSPDSASTKASFVQKHYNFNTPAFLTVDDEIVTYQPADAQKIPLVVGTTGSVQSDSINERFAQLHPECQIVTVKMSAGYSNELLPESLQSGKAPDVLYIATDQIVRTGAQDLYEDLSGRSVTQNYLTSALQDFSSDGELRFLPGPSAAYGMWYNKTLFDQHGWNVPATYDEFVDLCTSIESETNGQVAAFDPNAKYANVLCDPITAFSYAQTLASVDDATWLRDFKAGNATFAGHMEPLFQDFQKLCDAGVLSDENWSQSSTKRMLDFYDGKIAMINVPNEFTYPTDSAYEFATMTFPGTEAGQDYLVKMPAYALTVPIQQIERTSEKQALVDAYLEFASSAEAQSLFIGQTALIPSVKDLPSDAEEQATSEAVRNAIEEGRMFSREDFSGARTPVLSQVISDQFRAIANGQTDPAGACKAVDDYCAAWRANELPDETEVLAQATEDFTILETSEYMADKMREKTGADVALVLNNHIYRGNLIAMTKGDLTTTHADDLKLRSLTGDDGLRTVSMTGEQLLYCMNHPCDGTSDDDADCVYAFSGLKATVAPWASAGERVRETKLADGSDIDPKATYTVAIWGGTVHEEYASDVQQTFESNFPTFLAEAFRTDGTVAPARDGRMTLVWD